MRARSSVVTAWFITSAFAIGLALQTTYGAAPADAATEVSAALRPARVVNVRDFGARPGDDVDDTHPIRRALERKGVTEVVVPRGSYLVTGLTVPRSVRLRLQRGARLSLAAQANRPVVILAGRGARLEGGTVDGNRAQQSGGRWVGAVTTFASDTVVSGVNVVNAYGVGILARGAERIVVRNSVVRGTGNIGIFVEPVALQPLSGVTITGNQVDRLAEGGSIAEGGIKVHGIKGSPARVDSVLISSNVVRLPERPTDVSAIAIEVWGNVADARVINNRTFGGSMGVSLDDSVGFVGDNVVVRPSLYGVELASSVRSLVVANTITCQGVGQVGIVLANTEARDNRIRANRVAGCVKRGIQANAGAHGLRIEDNVVGGPSEFLLEVIASTDVRLAGNTLDGGLESQVGIVLDSSTHVTVERNALCRVDGVAFRIFADKPISLDALIIRFNTLADVKRVLAVELSGGASIGPGAVFGPNPIADAC